MIGGGIQEVESVKIAQRLGFFTIVTDRNQNAPCFAKADLGVHLDGTDIKGISSFIRKHKALYDVRGVFTCANLGTTVAAVAARCGLPGVSPKAARLGDDKAAQKKLLAAHGVPTPRFFPVSTYAQALRAYWRVGPEAVIKPSDSFGGQGVRKVASERELKAAYAEAKRYSGGRPIVVEEHVRGRFFDLEGIFCKGRFYPLAILDSYFTDTAAGASVSPIEYKNVYPAQIDEKTKRMLFDVTEKAARALGIDFGPVATDMVLTGKGPMIIEVSARLHGISANLQLIPRASGIKPVEALIKVMTGGSIRLSETKPRLSGVAINRCFLPPPGVITGIKGADRLTRDKSIVKLFLFKKPGDTIRYRNSGDVPAMVMAVASTLGRAEAAVAKAESLLKITTRKK